MKEQSVLEHLVELRQRLLYMLAAVVIIFIPFAYYSKQVYSALALPLLRILPAGANLVAINVPAPFLVPIKVSLLCAILVAVPFLLYQLWAFIEPALYPRERRLLLPMLFAGSLLFYLGSVFAYIVVLPLALQFFIGFAPEGMQIMTDAGAYIDFVLAMALAFGAAFELPVIIVLLVLADVLSLANLRQNRAYVLIGAFVVGMILTPPDVISQTLLAVPLMLLYELGILLAALCKRGQKS